MHDDRRLDGALDSTYPASDPIATSSCAEVSRKPLDAPPSRVARASTRDAALLELIDAVPEHVFVLGPDFSFLHANRALLDYHGQVLSAADVPLDRDVANVRVHHPDDVGRLAEEGCQRGETMTCPDEVTP